MLVEVGRTGPEDLPYSPVLTSDIPHQQRVVSELRTYSFINNSPATASQLGQRVEDQRVLTLSER